MTPGLALSGIVAFAVGFAALSLLLPRAERAGAVPLAFKVFLALGVGHGITACIAFVYLVVHGCLDRSYIFCELVVLVTVAVVSVLARKWNPRQRLSVTQSGHASRRYERLLLGAFGIAAAAALAAMTIEMQRFPYGDWDAWAIYNLRARGIYRGGYDWRDSFSELLYRSHPDYPLLLPLTVVRAWVYAGGESMAAPRMIGGLFMVATTGLVFSAVAALRGRAQACIAGVVLLGHWFLVRHASSQYADIPLMFFFAAAAALLVVYDEVPRETDSGALAGAGLAAGLAAWTKNEGVLFVLVLIAAHVALVAGRRGLRAYARQMLPIAAGLLPVLAIVIFFKSTLAPTNDLVSLSAGQSLAAKLADPERYLTIANELYERAPLRLISLLAIYGICVGFSIRRATGVAHAALTWVLLCAGYVAIYLVTPYDLSWHIVTSIDRLLVQVWPTFVLVYFMLLRTPEEIFLFDVAPQASPARG